MSTRTHAPVSPASAPSLSIASVQRVVLQRKCACGGSRGKDGECEECKKKSGATLQRRTANASEPTSVPPIVHEVLNSPGEPLDAGTRAFFEPRFGHDFSNVRVHADARAAQSARDVNATAYTVGRNIVLGANQFGPDNGESRRLLAHELTHVVQQRGCSEAENSTPRISNPGSQTEIEAETVALGLVSGSVPNSINPSGLLLSREKSDPTKAQGPSNHAKRPLTADEKSLIQTNTGSAAPTGSALAFTEGPRFVIHDTASRVELNQKEREKLEKEADEQAKKQAAGKDPGDKSEEERRKKELLEQKKRLLEESRQNKERRSLQEHQRGERGPLDEAAAAYVPAVGPSVIMRPSFFDPRRPTATEYEKRGDILTLANRESSFQKIWKTTNSKAQADALKQSLAGLEVSPKEHESAKARTERAISERKMTSSEISSEQKKAKIELEMNLDPEKTKKGKAQITTTAAWTVGSICDRLKKEPSVTLAAEGRAKDLETGCKQLGTYLEERDPRLSSSVNVEIIQPAGSACETNEKKFSLVPLAPYTEQQYDEVAKIYLQAALQAGQFPEIATHFWVDRFDPQGHCDPRCFRLQHLHDRVAERMGHAKGSTYGDKPNFGIERGKNNVWWHPKVCGGGHP